MVASLADFRRQFFGTTDEELQALTDSYADGITLTDLVALYNELKGDNTAEGVTTLQALLDSVYAPKNPSLNAQVDTSYTFVLTDDNKTVTLNNASAIIVTIPPNSSVAFPIGARIELFQLGAGQVTVAPGDGVTLRSTPTAKLREQYSAAGLVKIATDEWLVTGDLAAS